MAGSKFYGKKKSEAISDKELETLLSSALDVREEPAKVTEPITQKEEIQEIIESTPVVTSNHTAYNTYYDTTLQKFVLITVEYNPITKESKVVGREPIGDNYAVALYKLNQILTLKLVRGDERL